MFGFCNITSLQDFLQKKPITFYQHIVTDGTNNENDNQFLFLTLYSPTYESDPILRTRLSLVFVLLCFCGYSFLATVAQNQ